MQERLVSDGRRYFVPLHWLCGGFSKKKSSVQRRPEKASVFDTRTDIDVGSVNDARNGFAAWTAYEIWWERAIDVFRIVPGQVRAARTDEERAIRSGKMKHRWTAAQDDHISVRCPPLYVYAHARCSVTPCAMRRRGRVSTMISINNTERTKYRTTSSEREHAYTCQRRGGDTILIFFFFPYPFRLFRRPISVSRLCVNSGGAGTRALTSRRLWSVRGMSSFSACHRKKKKKPASEMSFRTAYAHGGRNAAPGDFLERARKAERTRALRSLRDARVYLFFIIILSPSRSRSLPSPSSVQRLRMFSRRKP